MMLEDGYSTIRLQKFIKSRKEHEIDLVTITAVLLKNDFETIRFSNLSIKLDRFSDIFVQKRHNNLKEDGFEMAQMCTKISH